MANQTAVTERLAITSPSVVHIDEKSSKYIRQRYDEPAITYHCQLKSMSAKYTFVFFLLLLLW